jgi:hypothetical protein
VRPRSVWHPEADGRPWWSVSDVEILFFFAKFSPKLGGKWWLLVS